MNELEGVIKYRLDFEKAGPVSESLFELNIWRSIMYRLGIIGQDDSRYEGYGFGNLSQNSVKNNTQFFISGTQTGNLAVLDQRHYVTVEKCEIESNYVAAKGLVRPSSEALTHAMFYQLDSSIQCVMHIHSPGLWNYGLENKFPVTHKKIEYGTPEMAGEIKKLYISGELAQSRTLVMAGHEDGVICFGNSVDQAGMALVNLWVRAAGAMSGKFS